MPKRGKQLDSLRDISIKDFADNKNAKRRIRKGKALIEEVVNSIDEMFGGDDGKISKQKSRRQPRQTDPHPNHLYADYCIDIWFVISEHIYPEDVGRFALICKNTAYVVSTAKFWLNLYRRYYKPTPGIPIQLQPESITRLDGLRAHVIRSLFYTYKPLVERLKGASKLEETPKPECVAMWYKKIKDYWCFCYKFRRKCKIKFEREVEKEEHQQDVPECFDDIDELKYGCFLSDINSNPEDGCRMLIIYTERFYPLPNVFTEKIFLFSITRPLSQNLCDTKLELKFANYCNESFKSIVYDPVKQCRVLDWWHPDYYAYLDEEKGLKDLKSFFTDFYS